MKSSRVSKESQRGRPAATEVLRSLAHAHDQTERNRAGDNANECKAGGVDVCLLERQSTKQGISGERSHRDQRQNEKLASMPPVQFSEDKIFGSR